MKKRKLTAFAIAAIMVFTMIAPSVAAYDGKDRIYTVATAHLDTVWNWDLETTIGQYLPKTFNNNFDFFEKYPEYEFNFEGAYRYELIEEYYPEAFEKIADYIEQDRWHVTGSAWENGDVNTPSAEALFRNILFGNNYFEEKFNKRSVDIFLPDCFGFGYALPSIMAHANLYGFTTQKLTWGLYGGPPFDLGKWYGVDGSEVYASLNPGDYSSDLGVIGYTSNGNRIIGPVRDDLSAKEKLASNKENYNLPWTARFHGTGDTGGSPSDASIQNVVNAIRANEEEQVEVLSVPADQIFRDMKDLLSDEQKEALPSHDNELLLTEHAAGAYTSRAIGKRWNRRNEQLADAAERANVASMWLGASEYPTEEFFQAWKRVIEHQFHDDIPGTSLMNVYMRSWNDYWISMKQFAEEYTNGVGGVASTLNTAAAQGVPVIVNNAVEMERTEPVEVTVSIPGAVSAKVYDANGTEVPSQVLGVDGNEIKLVFLATVPSMGYTVYDVRPADSASELSTGMTIENQLLENDKVRVTLDDNGDISSIIDKTLNKELLSAPIRTQLINNIGDSSWPSWELHYSDIIKSPYSYANQPAFAILENGPARISLEVTRTAPKSLSKFRQVITLTPGNEIVNVYNETDFFDKTTLVKHAFPVTAANDTATYDLGLGTIERSTNSSALYEVPGRNWADISNEDGSFGVSILSDSKYGWDKPDANTLRLTGVYTAQNQFSASHRQDIQDFGENRYSFGIYGHAGSYTEGKTQAAGLKFNQPMSAFETNKHDGAINGSYSFGSISNDNVIIRAIKKAEKTDEIIVRVNEGSGVAQTGVTLSLGNGIASAREVYGSEEDLGPATVADGKLVFDIGAFAPKTFAITLKDPDTAASKNQQLQLELPYNKDVISSNENRGDGGLIAGGDAIPSELLPDVVRSGGVEFAMGSKADGDNNAVAALGQTFTISAGYNKLYLLATSTNGDRTENILVNGQPIETVIYNYNERPASWDMYGLNHTGKIKSDALPGYVLTHRHDADKDEIAAQVYLFKSEIDIPVEGATIKLPIDSRFTILGATAVMETASIQEASTLVEEKEYKPFEPNEKPIVVTTAFENGSEPSELQAQNVPNTNVQNVQNPAISVSNEQAHTGEYSIKFSGTDASSSSSFAYMRAFDGQQIEIENDQYVLGFWLYAANDLGRHVSVDLYSGTTWLLRDDATCTSNSNSYTTGVRNHASYAKGEVGKWTYYEFPLANIKNRTVDCIMINYDYGSATGDFTAYIDDLFIGVKEVKEPEPIPYVEFKSGFEEGDPAHLNPPTGSPREVLNPSLEASANEAYEGNYSMRMTGYDNRAGTGTNISHMYYTLFNNLNIPITSTDTQISYMIKPVNELGRYVSIEIYFTDGTYIRDSGLKDQNGDGVHPSAGRGVVGQWNNIEVNLGWYLGKTLSSIQIAYDHSEDTGTYDAYIDNIFVGIPEADPRNRSTLKEMIEDAHMYDLRYYTEETAANLENILAEAIAVYNDKNAGQEQLDEMAEKLRDAIYALEEKSYSLSELLTKIYIAENLYLPSIDEYTPSTALAFKTSLNAAKAIAEKENPTGQEITKAYVDLDYTISNLVQRANKSLLQATVNYAKAQSLDKVNELIVEKFNAALAYAEAILKNDEATQEEVDNAAYELMDIIQYLSFTSDPTQLEALIAVAELIYAELDSYEEDGKEAFIAALEEAKAVLADKTSLDADYEEAVEKLTEAIQGLTVKKPIDTSMLAKKIAEAELIYDKLDEYLPIYKEEFIAALEAAKAVLDAPASQETVDEAVMDLHKAILNLRLIPDKSKLQALIDGAVKKDAALYTAESFAAFMEAVSSGQNVLDNANATVDEVKAAEAAIKNAEDELVTLKAAETGEAAEASGTDKDAGTETVPRTGENSNEIIFLLFLIAASIILYMKKAKK